MKLVNPISDYVAVLTPAEYARLFVDNLEPEQRRRHKRMLESGVSIGDSAAQFYNTNPVKFMDEVKRII